VNAICVSAGNTNPMYLDLITADIEIKPANKQIFENLFAINLNCV
jgi:hypothetical protein